MSSTLIGAGGGCVKDEAKSCSQKGLEMGSKLPNADKETKIDGQTRVSCLVQPGSSVVRALPVKSGTVCTLIRTPMSAARPLGDME